MQLKANQMKKFLISTFLLLILCSQTLIGQENKIGISIFVSNPSMNDIKLGWFDIDSESIDGYNLKHDSYSLGVTPSYLISEVCRVRLRLGRTSISINEYKDVISNTNIRTVESATGKQKRTHIAPGIVWDLKSDKISFYGGFELPINLHGEFDFERNFELTDQGNGDQVAKGTETITLPKGNSYGLGAIFGFRYNAFERFSIGAEMLPSLLRIKLSGETVRTNVSLFQPELTTTRTEDENKGITFYEQTFSILLTYQF
jgi:hypothetical protein